MTDPISVEVPSTEFVASCPVPAAKEGVICTWRGTIRNDQTEVPAHIAQVHPEVLEEDPTKAGRVYKVDIWEEWAPA